MSFNTAKTGLNYKKEWPDTIIFGVKGHYFYEYYADRFSQEFNDNYNQDANFIDNYSNNDSNDSNDSNNLVTCWVHDSVASINGNLLACSLYTSKKINYDINILKRSLSKDLRWINYKKEWPDAIIFGVKGHYFYEYYADRFSQEFNDNYNQDANYIDNYSNNDSNDSNDSNNLVTCWVLDSVASINGNLLACSLYTSVTLS
ncbi:hypothetical protein U3516DRAFT_739647 [Neocallimastix sp. 'constans']